MRGCALAIILGTVVGTSSSIFIASPILLFLRKTAATGYGSGLSGQRFRRGPIIKSNRTESAGPVAEPENPGKSLDSDVPAALGTIGYGLYSNQFGFLGPL